jgi:phage baseplate assembly protein W
MAAMNIAFPLNFDARKRSALTDAAQHVRDMIEQLLLTAPGERVNRPDFGSGLAQLVFAPNSPELAAALEYTLRAALQRWLGDLIEVKTLSVAADDARLEISVRYVLFATSETHEDVFVGGQS